MKPFQYIISSMKKSIRRKITVLFAAVLLAVIACIILCCMLFLNRFYLMNRQHLLVRSFYTIYSASEEGTLTSDEFQSTLRQLTAESSMSILVMDANGESIVSSGEDSQLLVLQLLDVLFADNETRVILETESYTIQRSVDDRFDEGESLLLRGTLANGEQVMCRITIQSMRESAGIAIQFVMIIGLIFVLIGSFLIYFISRSITDPILKLQAISKEMTELNFDVKYEPREENEIDQLGLHMNELSETLERTIGQLKAANNELQTDLARKEEIDRMRTDFLSNVSHELKTPIALIQGYAEGLKDCVQTDAESREFYCDVIIDEAGKMNRLVRKLLDLNQIEFGQHEIQMQRFDLTQLIREELDSMRLMLSQNDITMHFSQAEPVYVWADPYKIEEVLTNYLSNAVNHIDGERNIYVSVVQEGDSVRTGVRNTGRPIPEEDLDKIWDKFYKVDKSHSREYGGSGIGLSIVAAIMAAHHRPCGVINHDDGVEFWFTLDAAKGSAPAELPGEKETV